MVRAVNEFSFQQRSDPFPFFSSVFGGIGVVLPQRYLKISRKNSRRDQNLTVMMI